MSSQLVICGALITPLDPYSTRYLPDALIHVRNGVIECIEEEVGSESRLHEVLAGRGLGGIEVIRLREGEFLMPGFIDTHTHAPQFPNLGRGGQYELLDWLEKLTFPTEAKFGDKHYAEKAYRSVVRRLLDCGTTTCCYYATTHLGGTEVLADVVNASGGSLFPGLAQVVGQRAFIGKCNTDRNAPASIVESSVAESLESTRALVSHIDSLKSPLLRPVITPRFAIACTGELLQGLGDLAAEYVSPDIAIQTHVSENIAENKLTASLFPSYPSYVSIYDRHGLLGCTTILAHGCHLSDDELALIKKTGAGISHCPTSNFNLSSGVGRVGEWIDRGIKVGLGTDVSGGYSASMLTAVQHASVASKVIAMQAGLTAASLPPPVSTPGETVAESAPQRLANRAFPTSTLLHIATLGGAELCNLAAHTGSLAPGKAFDALLVSLRPDTGNPNVWWDDSAAEGGSGTRYARLEGYLEQFLFCGDDRNISATWVQGRLVGGRQFVA